jgi:hypothetical protein
MRNITFDKDELEELFGMLISYGIDIKSQRLCDAVRCIESELDLDNDGTNNEFLINAFENGVNFIIES